MPRKRPVPRVSSPTRPRLFRPGHPTADGELVTRLRPLASRAVLIVEGCSRGSGRERRAGRPNPQCAECGELWLPADADRWQAYLPDDEPPELAFYCPTCAEREFESK